MNNPNAGIKGISIAFLLLAALAVPSPVAAETVTVPVRLDFPLLRQLMLSQLFNTPDRSAEILHDPASCNTLFLSDPSIHEHRQKLEISTHVKANLATDILGSWTSLFNWEGDVRFLTEPVILPGARSLWAGAKINLHLWVPRCPSSKARGRRIVSYSTDEQRSWAG